MFSLFTGLYTASVGGNQVEGRYYATRRPRRNLIYRVYPTPMKKVNVPGHGQWLFVSNVSSRHTRRLYFERAEIQERLIS